MKGEEIYELAKESPVVNYVIPLAFVNTAPRISYKFKWRAEFWYYIQNIKNSTIYAPRFYISMEIPSGHLIEFQTFDTEECIGNCSELKSNQFYGVLNNYLEYCETVITQTPNESILFELDKKWKNTLPKALMEWFIKNSLFKEEKFYTEKIKKNVQSKNRKELLAKKLAEAISINDKKAIQQIKLAIRNGGNESEIY